MSVTIVNNETNNTESVENISSSEYASLKKLPEENTQQYLWRVDSLIRENVYMNWNSVCDIVNRELFGDDETKYKTESAYRKECASARRFFEAGVFATTSEDTIKQLRDEQDRLYAAKRQLSDQKREYNKLVVESGRRFNLSERLLETAQNINKKLPLLETPVITSTFDKEALMIWSDWHYGMVTDNIWNKYNTEICKARVKEFIEKSIEYLRLFGISKLHVILIGDSFHGSIHVSCRVSSEENTIDQIVHVSEIMAEAIEDLSKEVNEVHFYSCYGNHARTIQNKDESIHSDNLEKFIPFWLKQRLQNNSKVYIHESEYKEFTLIDILGYNVCCVHGDLDNIKDIGKTVQTLFSRKFGKNIDYVVSGDKHHLEEFESQDIECIISRSLCGTDEYANNKRLYSCPGQTLMIFNKDEGRECTRNIRVH